MNFSSLADPVPLQNQLEGKITEVCYARCCERDLIFYAHFPRPRSSTGMRKRKAPSVKNNLKWCAQGNATKMGIYLACPTSQSQVLIITAWDNPQTHPRRYPQSTIVSIKGLSKWKVDPPCCSISSISSIQFNCSILQLARWGCSRWIPQWETPSAEMP